MFQQDNDKFIDTVISGFLKNNSLRTNYKRNLNRQFEEAFERQAYACAQPRNESYIFLPTILHKEILYRIPKFTFESIIDWLHIVISDNGDIQSKIRNTHMNDIFLLMEKDHLNVCDHLYYSFPNTKELYWSSFNIHETLSDFSPSTALLNILVQDMFLKIRELNSLSKAIGGAIGLEWCDKCELVGCNLHSGSFVYCATCERKFCSFEEFREGAKYDNEKDAWTCKECMRFNNLIFNND